jgi:hypothetical protein
MTRQPTSTMNRRKHHASRVAVTVRLPKNVIKKIDLDVGRRAVPVSRNSWLLEAAIEKLTKIASGGSDGTK